MKLKIPLILVSIFIFFLSFSLIFSTSVSAAPRNNPIFATMEWVYEQIAVVVEEAEIKIASLASRVGVNETNIQHNQNDLDFLKQRADDLEERISQLEGQLTPTPTHTPTTFDLVESKLAPAVTDFDPPDEYKSITLKVSSTSNVVGWAPAVSFDGGSTYLEQIRISCNSMDCPEVTIPLLNTDFYRFQTGSSSGLVSVEATYNDEPDSQVLTLGEFVNYPFTSDPFSTDGYNTISITAGGGNNPQNVIGISLQRLEGGVYVEKEFTACDGGAVCPLATFPVVGGDYRVEFQGNGTGAVLGAILRN